MAARHRLLDLTRLVSRVGRGPLTGIDRVELAYLDRFLADPEPVRFLVATRRRFLVLDRPAGRAFRERLAGSLPWGPPDLAALLAPRLPWPRRLAEASLRREAEAAARPGRLGAHLPLGVAYYNVGHANLSAALLAELGAVPGTLRTVLIHDTIPVDHPEFSRPEASAAFAGKLAAVSAGADRVIYVSEEARRTAEAHFRRLGRVPPGEVAHIGVTLAAPDPATPLPPGPYFVTLGTIEPRKNHAFLLDVWEALAERLPADRLPRLLILGSRGWCSEALFRRLDSHPLRGTVILERAGLSDAAVAALVAGAAGLLHPSLAEGFGLPPLEAAARGVPVLAAPLPVWRETLGEFGVYLPVGDRYSWARAIEGLAEERARAGRTGALRPALVPPAWEAHFRAALTLP
ncbi:MAG: glycosyltransferase [Rhodobacteraceae bacterium]|nr:glycosyltransferase [Paracoccaceae bacterium]